MIEFESATVEQGATRMPEQQAQVPDETPLQGAGYDGLGVPGLYVAATTAAGLHHSRDLRCLEDLRSAVKRAVEIDLKGGQDQAPNVTVLEIFKRIFAPLSVRQPTYDELIAKYASLCGALDKADTMQFSDQALVGFIALTSRRLVTAYKIYNDIEFQISAPAALSYVMRGVGYFLRSIVTLLFLCLYSAAVIYFLQKFTHYLTFTLLKASSNNVQPLIASERFFSALLMFFNMPVGWVFIAAISGMLGSVVSILLRLGEFETTKGRSQTFLTLTGATLPIVGGVFGAFIAALLCSNVVAVTVGRDGQNCWLFLVVGFLSGFSERFSRGFIKIAEERLGGSSGGSSTELKVSAGTALMQGRSTPSI